MNLLFFTPHIYSSPKEIKISFKNVYKTVNHFIDKGLITLNDNIAELFNNFIHSIEKVKEFSIRKVSKEDREIIADQFNVMINLMKENKISYNQILTIYMIDEICKMGAYGSDITYKYFADIESILTYKYEHYKKRLIDLFTYVGLNIHKKEDEEKYIRRSLRVIKKWCLLNKRIFEFYFGIPLYYDKKLRIKYRILKPVRPKRERRRPDIVKGV